MKSFLIASIAMFSLSAFAQEEVSLKLDASCSILCQVSVKEVGQTQSGYSYEKKYEKAYFDLSGLSRKSIERIIDESRMAICEKKFGNVIQAEKPDCLIFKH
jgi:hypothetical protein